MTAAADVILPETQLGEPARMVDGARMIVRGAQRIIGAALAMAALGLWLAPGSSWDGDVMLFKLILSLTAIFAGFGLMLGSVRPPLPEVEVDTIRREVRLVRRERGTKPVVIEACSFAQLTDAEFDKGTVRLWDQNGIFLAEFSPTDRNALNSLLAGLRDAGKLA